MGLWIRAKGASSKYIFFLRVFEKRDPDILPKSETSKISCSSHSKKSHIELNLYFSCRAERCGPPFIFFYGLDVEIRPIWTPPELFIHLGGAIGMLLFPEMCLQLLFICKNIYLNTLPTRRQGPGPGPGPGPGLRFQNQTFFDENHRICFEMGSCDSKR